MDAHLLHLAIKPLESIVGSRISKIYQYDDDIYVFSLFGKAKKTFLIARTGKNLPFIFLSDMHNARGEEPPASVMRLRKHIGGKRIINMFNAWWERKVYFQVKQDDDTKAHWFKVDLKKGVYLCDSPFAGNEEAFNNLQPSWPELENIESLYSILNPKDNVFSPYFTPALRKTIQEILRSTIHSNDGIMQNPSNEDEQEALLEVKSLLIDLESGEGDLFMYSDNENKKELFAWQLPLTLQKERIEEIFDNPQYALNEYGKSSLFSTLSDNVKKNAAKPHQAQIKKLKNLQSKLEGEEDRLLNMLNKKELALKLQANLYNYNKEEKISTIVIEENSYELDKRLSIKENMENLFHQSNRGKRGLIHLEKRKQEVLEELENAKTNLHQAIALSQAPKSFSLSDPTKDKKQPIINGKKNEKKSKNFPKQVLYRESQDGFTILLGKDVKGNALALKLASPHDYWLHTADSASAHAIIKREHQAQVIPEKTLEEAGRMVAEKSPYKNSEKALIQYALAKNIQPMKGAGKGMVRIVKSEGSLWVSLQEDKE